MKERKNKRKFVEWHWGKIVGIVQTRPFWHVNGNRDRQDSAGTGTLSSDFRMTTSSLPTIMITTHHAQMHTYIHSHAAVLKCLHIMQWQWHNKFIHSYSNFMTIYLIPIVSRYYISWLTKREGERDRGKRQRERERDENFYLSNKNWKYVYIS